MKTNRKVLDKTCLITTGVCLLPVLLGLAVYGRLPEQVAVHWRADGQPNGWMHKNFAVWVIPAFLAGLNLLCHIGGNSDPRREAQSQRLLTLVKWLPAVLSLIVCPITLFIAMGADISVSTVTSCIIGAMFIVVGNYLPKCRQNNTMGIKLPWTLNDEDNWNRTHRLAGPLWMLGGALFLFCGLFNLAWAGITLIFLMALIPTAYSFFLSRKRGS